MANTGASRDGHIPINLALLRDAGTLVDDSLLDAAGRSGRQQPGQNLGLLCYNVTKGIRGGGNDMLTFPIYLDHHATTRTDPRVLEAMLPYFTEQYGNASSVNHAFGEQAQAAVDAARHQVALLLNAHHRDILFTCGATESNNTAIKGVAEAYRHKGRHLITVATEHPSVLGPCEHLERQGWTITILPVDEFGRVAAAQVEDALRPETVLVSVMLANNEVGTLQPLAEIGAVCKKHNVLLHSDATQAVGKIPVDVQQLQVDLLSLSAHKFHGPKGVGALYLRRKEPRVRLEPLLHGGGQEHQLRSGTLNTPGIVGLGKACEIAREEMAEEAARVAALRDRLYRGLLDRVPDLYLNGHPTERLPGNLNVSIGYVQGEALLLSLPSLALSSGAACATKSNEPSPVLRAMGRSDELADASLRFGLGRFNTQEEIDFVLEELPKQIEKLRLLSAAWQGRTPHPV